MLFSPSLLFPPARGGESDFLRVRQGLIKNKKICLALAAARQKI